jgi:hypothetical protein
MSRAAARALAAALAALAAASGPAAAQDGVRRCVASDGRLIFTDRPCDALQAVPAGDPAAPDDGRPPAFSLRECPRTPGQLGDEARLSFATRDVNRLAGLFDWSGWSSRSAESRMADLDDLLAHRLVEVRVETPEADDPALVRIGIDGDDADAPPPMPVLVIALEPAGGGFTPDERRYPLHEHAACWWMGR